MLSLGQLLLDPRSNLLLAKEVEVGICRLGRFTDQLLLKISVQLSLLPFLLGSDSLEQTLVLNRDICLTGRTHTPVLEARYCIS